ncbi:rubrerythrin family protein [Archaeoglobus veneficus]|uniref:Rubrerythrin n=1 Tax=Archaeoglobus veneficus (strain DSM 11195 / SNP6) TaxID=693661 RepID=F2KT42_ARCVS|nr:rubrerythrin family protein [Archaeoglobus veneficus]AEA47072.1 Rubrerythrin [Archaeoglobus veneficus SNP6]
MKAYIGESITMSRYAIYSEIAKNEKYMYVAKYFAEVAENEKKHAEIFANFLKKFKVEPVEVEVKAPILFGNTSENLSYAVEGEHFESAELYPGIAEIAEKDGLKEVAEKLRALAEVESFHERKFRRLLEEIEKGTMFKRDSEIKWMCLVCGYVHKGTEPPKVCPNCGAEYYNFVARDLLVF